MESFQQHNQPESEEILYGGRRFEVIVAEPISCEWDGEKFVELQKSDRTQASLELNHWIEQHVMPIKEWNRLAAKEKKETIFSWVETHQPEDWDPKDPPIRTMHFGSEEFQNPYANNLHEAVATALNLEDYNELELFTCVDTPADTLYGTDLFFKYKGVRLLLDATVNLEEKNRKNEFRDKADYIISWNEHDEDGRRRQPTEFELQQEGQRIAKYLNRKVESTEIAKRNLAA